MEKGDRRIDRIVIAANLNVDVFRIRVHDSSVVFLGFALNPKKTSSPRLLASQNRVALRDVKIRFMHRAAWFSLGV
jgi:hypothetical protein